MRAERNASAAVDAYKGFAGDIEIDRVHRACPGAFTAADAEIFF